MERQRPSQPEGRVLGGQGGRCALPRDTAVAMAAGPADQRRPVGLGSAPDAVLPAPSASSEDRAGGRRWPQWPRGCAVARPSRRGFAGCTGHARRLQTASQTQSLLPVALITAPTGRRCSELQLLVGDRRR